jgi:hypothetical protein
MPSVRWLPIAATTAASVTNPTIWLVWWVMFPMAEPVRRNTRMAMATWANWSPAKNST